MPVITIQNSDGKQNQVRCETGQLIADVLFQNGQFVKMPCGGKGICGKCKIQVLGNVSPLSQNEKNALSQQEIEQGIRLACCTKTTETDCTIKLPKQKQETICSKGTMPQFEKQEIFEQYGIAIDIGTTTLAARLYGKTGLLAEKTAANPQTAFGADVISRIEKAMNGQQKALAESIRTAINELIEQMCFQANVLHEEIDTMVIVGNTAMLYLLCERNPKSISQAPFESEYLFGEWQSALHLGIQCPNCMVYLPPCISAFVGADITAAVLASQICQQPKTQLLVDIGTNGEMALWNQKRLFCCSTAAGPAFEGAGLWMGMNAQQGAVDSICVENTTLRVHTIGNKPAVGICGSGVIDAVSCAIELGVIDETGYLEQNPFLLTDTVGVNQQDIRKIQLAKAAIYAGIKTLLMVQNLEVQQLDCLKIAGGFGTYLDLKNAQKIGLLPQLQQQKIQVLGNAALTGASMILLNGSFQKEAMQIANNAMGIDLSKSEVFQNEFVESMLFETE